MAFVKEDTLPPIQPSAIVLGLEKVATLPSTRTSSSQAVTLVQELTDAPDASARLYALDTRGVVWVVENGSVASTPFLDLRGRADFVEPAREAGLRSLAFHPDFQTAGSPGYGKVYTSYTAPVASAPAGVPVYAQREGLPGPVHHSVLAEWTLRDPARPLQVDPTSKRELFRIEEPYTNHNLSALLFNPNAKRTDPDYGRLYVSVADGGSAYDPGRMAQDLAFMAGKILRIDPLAQRDGSGWGIPGDNPFRTTPGALPEIWALGFRHPQAMSFDRGPDGRLFVSDIGQDSVEEINVVLRGQNYGWAVREGGIYFASARPTKLAETPAEIGDFQYPFTGYDHEEIG